MHLRLDSKVETVEAHIGDEERGKAVWRLRFRGVQPLHTCREQKKSRCCIHPQPCGEGGDYPQLIWAHHGRADVEKGATMEEKGAEPRGERWRCRSTRRVKEEGWRRSRDCGCSVGG
jgi:hypothetical protein